MFVDLKLSRLGGKIMLLAMLTLVQVAMLLLVQGGCGYEARGLVQHVAGEELTPRVQEAIKALVSIEVAGEKKKQYYSSQELLEHYYKSSSWGRLPSKGSGSESSGGSGFFIDVEKGYIVTNEHVVNLAKFHRLRLKLVNGKTYEGELIGRDEFSDVAVVAIKDENFDRSGLGQLSFGDSDALQLGETVFTLGAPSDGYHTFEKTVTAGIVSGLNRYSQRLIGKQIQIDADTSGGNSGGPLLNMAGEVVGINAWIAFRYGGDQIAGNMNFAITSNTAQRVVQELLANGAYQYGYIGAAFRSVSEEMRGHLQLNTYPEMVDGSGVLVNYVLKDKPAVQGGLRAGDVVYAIGEQRVKNVDEAIEAIALAKPESELAIHVLRSGRKGMLKVKVGQRPTADQQSPLQKTEHISGWSLEVAELRKDSDFYRRTRRDGLLVLLEPDYVNIKRGDFIIEMDGVAVNNLEQFEQYLAAREEVMLYIERKAGDYFYVLLKKEKE